MGLGENTEGLRFRGGSLAQKWKASSLESLSKLFERLGLERMLSSSQPSTCFPHHPVSTTHHTS